jgi:pyruvate kinase
MTSYHRTKIVATIGPVSRSQEVIERFIIEGVNVFRLNFSHGSHQDHKKSMDFIRAAEKKLGRCVGVLADLQGPKLRVGKFTDTSAELKEGQDFLLDLDKTLGSSQRVQFPHKNLYQFLAPGDQLLLDDGKIKLRIQSVASDKIHTNVEVGGRISNHKGVNIPDSLLKVSALTSKDLEDLIFIETLGVDYIALSFVQSEHDIRKLKQHLTKPLKIIAKIEKPQALKCIDAILEEVDGIMVARGDLGVEMELERVPLVQKELISKARLKGVPVIVATQMLESMISLPTPTRAEVSDVANAVLDGADAVMLSAESAAGDYPIEAVQMMVKVIHHTEKNPMYSISSLEVEKSQKTTSDAIARAASYMADSIGATLIVCTTVTGSTPLRVSQARGHTPILAITSSSINTARWLSLVWGVQSYKLEGELSFETMSEKIQKFCINKGIVSKGDKVVVTGSNPIGKTGETRLIKVLDIEE